MLRDSVVNTLERRENNNDICFPLRCKDGVVVAGDTRVFIQPDMVSDSPQTEVAAIDKHNTSSASFLIT